MLAALPAIATIGSGLLNFFGGQSAQDKAIQAQQQINEQNWQHSLYMANNSVQMRAEDAEKAGINKLYAIGAPTMSFAPSQVGAAGTPYNAMKPLADTMHGLGQDLSRAGIAGQSLPAKVAAVESAQRVMSNNLDNEAKQLQLQILRARLANLTGTAPTGPFNVPESAKIEGRPPLMAGGMRIETSPDTSNAEDFEKRYGDDGPASWLINTGILARDAFHTAKGVVARWKAQNAWDDLNRRYPNTGYGQ